jgi:hypothetical protein
MPYALCIKAKPTEIVFRINASSLEEARKKFIGMKQMTETEFNKIFMVVEVKHGR